MGNRENFFVKQSKVLLDSFNPNSSFYGEEYAKRIRESASKQNNISIDDHLPIVTAYYDAWMHDNEMEPILSLLYEIAKDNCRDLEDKQRSITKVLAAIAGIVTKRNASGFMEALEGNNLFEQQKNNRTIRSLVNDFFSSLLIESGNKLIVFIDELDRCSPSYAVKLLERIKHYFDCDNVIFVFSVNLIELQHTIKTYYGQDFDACRYLDRFFEFRMELPPIDLIKFIEMKGFNNQNNLRESVCAEVSKQMHMGMREVTRYIFVSRMAAGRMTDGQDAEKRRHWSHDEGISLLIGYSIVVPIAMGLKLTNTKEYEDFVSGRDYSWLKKIVMSEKLDYWVTSMMLSPDETYVQIEGRKLVDKEERIKEIYDVIFNDAFEKFKDQKTIGRAVFEKGIKESVFRAIGLASNYTDYKVN